AKETQSRYSHVARLLTYADVSPTMVEISKPVCSPSTSTSSDRVSGWFTKLANLTVTPIVAVPGEGRRIVTFEALTSVTARSWIGVGSQTSPLPSWSLSSCSVFGDVGQLSAKSGT